MKKISAELIVEFIKNRFEVERKEVEGLMESLSERRGFSQYKNFLDDCLEVFKVLEQPHKVG